jgi:hypothetical protein
MTSVFTRAAKEAAKSIFLECTLIPVLFFSKKMFRGTLSLTQENHLVSLNMTKHICCQHTLHKT